MKPYTKIRDFTLAELNEEVGEYFENEYTFGKFPNLAKDENELKKMIKNARLINLTEAQMMKLDNSDVSDIISHVNPFAATFKMAQQNGRNIDRIYEGIKNNISFPAPIIIRKGSSLYLMGGNTRICAFAAINMSISVKVLEHR